MNAREDDREKEVYMIRKKGRGDMCLLLWADCCVRPTCCNLIAVRARVYVYGDVRIITSEVVVCSLWVITWRNNCCLVSVSSLVIPVQIYVGRNSGGAPPSYNH